MKLFAMITVVGLMVVAPASGAILAEWTFEVSGPNLILNDSMASPVALAEGGIFGGSAFGAHAGAATDWSSPAGNGSIESFSVNTWASGDYWQFQTSSTGYTDITISWDQTRSSTGPANFRLEYSTNGVVFTQLGSNYVVLNNTTSAGPPATTPWSTSGARQSAYTFGPIAGPAALDNKANIYFRLTCLDSPAAGGTNRVDNVLIEGVPEPMTLTLLGLGGLTILRRRK
jgi:hypothetical protein